MEDIEHRTTGAFTQDQRVSGAYGQDLARGVVPGGGRKTWYESAGQIQADLDRFMEYYNLQRSHQGYRLKGRTPAQELREALGVEELPPIV